MGLKKIKSGRFCAGAGFTASEQKQTNSLYFIKWGAPCTYSWEMQMIMGQYMTFWADVFLWDNDSYIALIKSKRTKFGSFYYLILGRILSFIILWAIISYFICLFILKSVYISPHKYPYIRSAVAFRIPHKNRIL